MKIKCIRHRYQEYGLNYQKFDIFKEEYFVLPNGKKQGEFKSWCLLNAEKVLDTSVEDYYSYWNLENKIDENMRQCFIHCFYNNDILQGKYMSWHKEGPINYSCNFKNGKKEGEFTSWCRYTGNVSLKCFLQRR